MSKMSKPLTHSCNIELANLHNLYQMTSHRSLNYIVLLYYCIDVIVTII